MAQASAGLVGLYFLLKAGAFWIIMVLIVFFGLAALSALAYLIFDPLVACCCPATADKELCTSCGAICTNRDAITFALSLPLVVLWFVGRHTGWAWALQDVFAVCVCCVFLLVLKLPSGLCDAPPTPSPSPLLNAAVLSMSR